MVYEFTTPQLAGPVRISVRRGSTAVAVGVDDVFSFDAEGRLLTAYRGGHLFKRGLDHRVMEKWRTWSIGLPNRIRRDLSDDEKVTLVAQVGGLIARVRDELPADVPASVRARLDASLRWKTETYLADRQRFYSVYTPIGILPPDQYMALVLQATEGCHYNRCTFCDFYRGQRFHIKTEAEFRDHIDGVQAFLGAGIVLRHTIFLADANALVIPQRRLLPLFDLMHDAFDIAPAHLTGRDLSRWKAAHPAGISGIYSFMDAFTGAKKSRDDFAALAERGLRRVYIGMESGHEPLLSFLRKPSMPADVREVVHTAKGAGVNVGIIIMLGIGGDRYAAGHVGDTIEAVNRLELGAGDIVYFSEFVCDPESAYNEQAQAAGIRMLSGDEIRNQMADIRAGLDLTDDVRISTYDIREFIY